MLLFLYWLKAIDSLWYGLDYTLPLGKVKAWKMEVVITLREKAAWQSMITVIFDITGFKYIQINIQ